MDPKSLQQTGEKLMLILMFTMIISMMSAIMFNIVLPEISEEFGLSISQVSWFSSAYALIYAIGTVTYGKLADHYKLKNLLTFGLIIFAIGSLVGLVSQTFWLALVGRCLQSVGASAIPAIAMMVPIRYFAPERRGSALGMSAVGLAIGSALGPVVAVFIVSVAHWRWFFAIPLLILITLPLYRKYLGNEHHHESTNKFDWMGGGLLAGTVALLLLGVTNGTGWFIVGGLLLLVLFIIRIRMAADPFVQPKLFKNSKYTIVLPIAFLINGMGASLPFLSPLFLTNIHQLPTSWIGFVMVPAAAVTAILGRKGGKLADRKGNSYLFYMASGLLLICFGSLSIFIGSSPVWIAIYLIFGNLGSSFILLAMSNSISRTLPKDQIGVGMGMYFMLNFISQGMSTGVYSKLVDLGTDFKLNPVNQYPDHFIYSNIFFVLAILQVGILLFYYFQFGREKSTSIASSKKLKLLGGK